jgi:hypothetical protein
MSTLFVLSDGRIWGCTNGEHDLLVELVAETILKEEKDAALSDWLLAQRCQVQGPGVGYVDLRELTLKVQEQIVAAIPKAVVLARVRGPAPGVDPSRFASFIEHLELLNQMVESMKRGEPPEALTASWWKLHPPTGERKGPGW